MGDPELTLFLGGDLMTGRGIDQVLRHPAPPELYEPFVSSALDYVALAERAHGPIPRPVDFRYVWGDLLELLDAARPWPRIVNLETAVTARGEPDPKGIHYRMHPANVPVLAAARLDACALANNHVLDWGVTGLFDTLEALARARIAAAGAGADLEAAAAPAVLARPEGGRRVVLFACGLPDSGVPRRWAAGPERPGVFLLPDLSERTVRALAARIEAVRRPGDAVVLSIHWGPNWGYGIPAEHRWFAHAVVEEAGVDLVHGHSSHHPKGIEVYRGRPILYGCGDLLNDYEGIAGYEEYRGDLVLAYLPALDGTGRLARFELAPFRVRRFRLERPPAEDRDWLRAVLDRECGRFGHRVVAAGETFRLEWS